MFPIKSEGYVKDPTRADFSPFYNLNLLNLTYDWISIASFNVYLKITMPTSMDGC